MEPIVFIFLFLGLTSGVYSDYQEYNKSSTYSSQRNNSVPYFKTKHIPPTLVHKVPSQTRNVSSFHGNGSTSTMPQQQHLINCTTDSPLFPGCLSKGQHTKPNSEQHNAPQEKNFEWSSLSRNPRGAIPRSSYAPILDPSLYDQVYRSGYTDPRLLTSPSNVTNPVRPFAFNFQSDNGISIDVKGFSPSDMEQVALMTPDGSHIYARWVTDQNTFRLEITFK